MGEIDHRAIVEAFTTANVTRDYDAFRRLCHPDFVLEWPATGEIMRGIEAAIAVDRAYPGLPDIEVRRLTGAEDRWVLDAGFTPRRIIGSGDVWVAEATMTYPDGSVWEFVEILELRDGRAVRATEYWAPRSEPPAWRTGLTERTR